MANGQGYRQGYATSIDIRVKVAWRGCTQVQANKSQGFKYICFFFVKCDNASANIPQRYNVFSLCDIH